MMEALVPSHWYKNGPVPKNVKPDGMDDTTDKIKSKERRRQLFCKTFKNGNQKNMRLL